MHAASHAPALESARFKGLRSEKALWLIFLQLCKNLMNMGRHINTDPSEMRHLIERKSDSVRGPKEDIKRTHGKRLVEQASGDSYGP